ncbi:MAG: hypothetical protein IPP32_12830 [Bacteroidetes bacterium]|nr:hypothetical protein [Bacteroidota bacterium]
MDKVKITFFGIGCRVAIGKFNPEDWERLHGIAEILAVPLSEAVFDSTFFVHLADSNYKQWFDLGNHFKVFGLLNNYQSTIEIRINGKKQRKILSNDLIDDNLLFPLYKTDILASSKFHQDKGDLIIVEKEIGTLANYRFETESFSIDKLYFSLQSIHLSIDMKFSLLTNLSYAGKELISKKSDTLVKERFALL